MSTGNPNTILEINQTHTDNFLLVIPEMPSLKYLGSYFLNATTPNIIESDYPSTTPGVSSAPECGDGPEFIQSNYNSDTSSTSSTGSSGTSGTSEDCQYTSFAERQMQIRRELNLDMHNFQLYITNVEMPDVSIDTVRLGTQFATMSRASKIQFTDLNTQMIISENLLNYNAILFWMYALHNPERYHKLSGRQMTQEYFQDIYLIITNNHREKVAEYKFIDAFPINMSSLPWSWQATDRISVPVTWAHSGMFITNNFVLQYV